MRDVLPADLIEAIGDQYNEAVREAEPHFQNYQADEDAITGALGSSMDRTVKGARQIGDKQYTWSTRTVKLRGRGPRAPEREYGADGILEVEVRDESGNGLARKLVPFQAKKADNIDRQVLLDQANRLNTLPGGGLILVYDSQGYRSASASDVQAVHGVWHQVSEGQRQDFGAALKNGFLPCTVGSRSLYYDAARERMVALADDGTSRDLRLPVRRRTRTIIKRRAVRS